MPRVDPTLITGVTAVAGTLLGGLTSFATSYLTQGRQTHADRILRELDRRKNVYARFIEIASELALDALEQSTRCSPPSASTSASTSTSSRDGSKPYRMP
jgi:hypothetical protein